MNVEKALQLNDSVLHLDSKKLLGQILLEFGYITRDELDQAIKLQNEVNDDFAVYNGGINSTMRIGQILVEKGIVTNEKVEAALTSQRQVLNSKEQTVTTVASNQFHLSVCILATVTFASIIFFLSLINLNLIFIPQWVLYPAHFFAYLCLCFLIYTTLQYSPWKMKLERKVITAFLGAFAFGFLIELIQVFVPHRFFSLLDTLINFSGAFSAALFVTYTNWGLAEINYPPTEEMEEELRLKHSSIGKSFKVIPFKRIFDFTISFLGFLFSLPIWLFVIFIIWLEDPGPIFFIKTCVGKGGKSFRQLKFRTMIKNAERNTGPVLAQGTDPRFLRIGNILRKTALDELPQLLNILKGNMSFVGPRPQRTILVHKYLGEIPKYALRHTVKPGLTGIAQLYGHYYVTPRQKLRFDLIYLRKRGFWFDLKLFIYSFIISLGGGWQNSGSNDKKSILA
ncbi:MAG TPA: VanZ family protein [Thermodesulfobacteriota bacterium]